MHIIHDVYGYIGLSVFASCNSRAVNHSSEHSLQGLAALQALAASNGCCLAYSWMHVRRLSTIGEIWLKV